MRCGDCGEKWQAGRPRDRAACPACSSPNVVDSYPEIPSLDHDPLLALVLDVESQIPRTDGGVILHREMVAWLRFHGVRDRAEMLTWEWFFTEIGGIRARIVEEMTAPTPGKSGETEED